MTTQKTPRPALATWKVCSCCGDERPSDYSDEFERYLCEPCLKGMKADKRSEESDE